MSIFKKISILFIVSIVLMFYISNLTKKITNEKIELIHKEKYVQASKELFGYLINADLTKLQKQAKNINYEQKKLSFLDKTAQTIYKDTIYFGQVRILKQNDIYLLHMKYFDDEFLFFDKSQMEELKQKKQLKYLIVVDSILLVIIFLILINILTPLKNIANAIEKFGQGDFSWRLRKSDKKDEIAKVTNQFNIMAENIEQLMLSRKQLLNDISHELRTPISKAMLSLEMIEDSKYKRILKKSIQQMDKLTNEILNLERLGSKTLKLDIKEHKIETILLEALSSMIVDEKNINITIEKSFTCKADLNYFAMAIKNLIDNAIKYKKEGIVKIYVKNSTVEIQNKGDRLYKDLDYYLEAFTQEDNSRNIKGYGLGLNIVKRVLDKHKFQLEYNHKNGYNIFRVIL